MRPPARSHNITSRIFLVLCLTIAARPIRAQQHPEQPAQVAPPEKPTPKPNTADVGKPAKGHAVKAPALVSAQAFKISPSSGTPGTVVTISGSGFGTTPGVVTFNGVPAPVPAASWSDSIVQVVVPAGLPAGGVTLTVAPRGHSAAKSMPFTVSASPPRIFGRIAGDFHPFISAGVHSPVQITLLNQEMEVVGQSVNSSYTETELKMFYVQPDSKSVPVWALVGIQSPGDHLFPFEATKAQGADSSRANFDELISGDFCLSDAPIPGGKCTTGLITVDTTTGAAQPGNPPVAQINAVVQAADATSTAAVLQSIGLATVRVMFTAPKSFKPAWLILEGTGGAHKFAWAPAPPDVVADLVYTSDDLRLICTAGKCLETDYSKLVLTPIDSDAKATLVALQNTEKDTNNANSGGEEHLLVARVRAPMGLEPTAIQVVNTQNNPPTSIIVRRTLKPGQVVNVLDVDMSIMDQTTAQRNFGQRIAKRYMAVTLDVRNPTTKKMQFNKGALYFDVDYIDVKKRATWQDFRYSIETVTTLGMRDPDPYVESKFVKADSPRRFRFGLEQNVHQSAINYLSALGSFDATTEETGKKFDTLQLLASIMNTIATGGIAGTPEFRSAAALLSGVFLPGLKGIILNDSHINRLRSNLVTQTLQQVIEIPAGLTASTIVLLPRDGILTFHNAEIPVTIDRILDVHLVPQVVSEVNETPIVKDQCKVDYTKDQTREALGEPAGVSTNSDGTSVFTFPAGPVSSASFSVAGKLVSCQQRSNTDQLSQSKTLVEFNQTVSKLGLNANKITLTDSSVVAVDVPGVQQTFHFDSKGNKATDYTFLFSQIKTYEKGTKAALEAYLEKSGTALSTSRATEIKSAIDGEAAQQKKQALKAGATVKYPSPDIQNGTIILAMKDATTIDTIAFEGDKPASQK